MSTTTNQNIQKKCREYSKDYTCTLYLAEAGERDIYVIFSEYDLDKDDNIVIGIGTPNSEERLIVDVEVVEDLRTIEILRLVLDRELEYNHPENTVVGKVLSAYNPNNNLSDYILDNQLSHTSNNEKNDNITSQIKNKGLKDFLDNSRKYLLINETLIYIFVIVLLFILRLKVIQ